MMVYDVVDKRWIWEVGQSTSTSDRLIERKLKTTQAKIRYMKPWDWQSLIRIVLSPGGVVEEQLTWSRWSMRWMVEAPVTGLELQKVHCCEVAVERGTYRAGGLQGKHGLARPGRGRSTLAGAA